MNPEITHPIVLKPSRDYPETINTQVVLKALQQLKERLSAEAIADLVIPSELPRTWQELDLRQGTKLIPESILSGLESYSVDLLGVLLGWKPLIRLQKIARLVALVEIILAAVDQGVETLPLLKVPELQPIDLFVRFPGKEFLLFAIRSFGKATIVYNESKQTLYWKRGAKGTNKWKPDPLTELSEQAYWLKKNRRDLFGSSRGVRKPMAKVLIVWGQTQLQKHADHLYATIGGQPFLFLPREGGACYVIRQIQIADFIRAYLRERM